MSDKKQEEGKRIREARKEKKFSKSELSEQHDISPSHMSDVKNGKADICLGTRSAIFAPFENLGLIVMDEEQEHTYKSDQNPKYHARDIARFRCAKAGALMLLASATPSIESFYKAKNNIYHLVTLR